ncbi:response regulator [Parasalinivibrio latis]|uniref:response regulator n=1 Tax=Parasalinivibrio latis TaxID=2952610 RepID=UPI0030E55B71
MSQFLIVEDSYAMALALEKHLSDAVPGQNSLIALNVESAMVALLKNHIDCVFLDLNLNGHHDGIGVLAYIRKKRPKLPVIIVTGDSSKEAVKKVIAYRPFGYLVKPATLEKVIQLIDTLDETAYGRVQTN